MKNIKYIALSLLTLGFLACESDDDSGSDTEVLPELTAGNANFSSFVALGNSLTAGFADGTLYSIAQENSTPSIMADQFSLIGGGNFTQPLMNDNTGGLLAGGSPLPGFGPRLVFNGTAPVPITSLNPGAMTTTDIVLNNPTGPFNNMGVPGAKSFHLLAPGYGNFSGLFAVPATANPFFVRMASSTTTSVIADAMAQAPTFFSLWIGNNDVLGYALSGGESNTMSEDYDPITPQATFDFAYSTLVSTLTAGGAQGVVANIPDVTAIPHFTTVPHNPVPLDAATAGALNQGYATYNGGLQFAFTNGLLTQEEVDKRTVVFSESANNALVLIDEDLTDLSSFGIPNYRQATAADLFLLPLLSLIPQGYGTQIQLEDKWVLTPEEQLEIKMATDAFNATIQAEASGANLAFVDANALLNLLKDGNLPSGNYNLTSDFVTGGAFSLDGVHPTSRGYALLANQFLKAIDLKYGSNFEASGNLVDIGTYNTNYSAGLQ
tara:strand:+ start:18551 stop:20029 length:1479 start_codon:yes stop_codon:yes gene_type:complete